MHSWLLMGFFCIFSFSLFSNQHFLPVKSKSIMPDLLCGDAFCLQGGEQIPLPEDYHKPQDEAVVEEGLLISGQLPKVKPLYHLLTPSFSCLVPWVSRTWKASASVTTL